MTSFGFAHAERLALGGDDDGVVQEPVEEADGGGVFGQEAAPVLERPVRSDAKGSSFVGRGDQAEEQLGAVVVEGREADLIDLSRRRDRSIYADSATIPTR